jgi:outer membrane murein-binding lipoprotein Lpp
MGRAAEAEEPDALAGLHARDAQAAKADDARAEQRRDVQRRRGRRGSG